MLNKKAELGDQVSVISFLFLLIIVGLAIIAGVYLFYISDADFREVESQLLSYKIKNCMLNNELNKEFFETEFFDKCGFDKKVLEEKNILRVCEIKDERELCIDSDSPLFFLGRNFQSCNFKAARTNSAFPRCFYERFTKGEKRYEIIAGSNQFSRRSLT